jgi:hypothetical protein
MIQKLFIVMRKSAALRRVVIWAGLVLACTLGETRAALPDLIPNTYRLKTSVEIQRRYIPAGNCAIVEGCVSRAGTRRLLLFDAGVANIGKRDLVIGDPATSGKFVYSPCHAHYHMRGFAIFRLFTRNWTQLVKSRKQGFCLRDDRRYFRTAGPGRGYNCNYQGISRGWQDVYDKSLDCQWLDITGVPPGQYYLEVFVNPAGVLKESNYRNNRVVVPVTIPVLRS